MLFGQSGVYQKKGFDQFSDLNFEDDGSGKCVDIMDGQLLGYWFVTQCSKLHSYMCEHPRQGFTTPPPPTTTTPPPEAK